MKLIVSLMACLFLGFNVASAEGKPPQQLGPWNHNLEIFELTPEGELLESKTVIERGGVPNLVRGLDGTLYLVFQWFPLDRPNDFDRIAISKSTNDGLTWSEPEPITIDRMPKNLFRAFDPTLVALPEGGFRLYFTSERASPERPRGNRAIFSAHSQDALHYTFEVGQRFGFKDWETYDPAVVFFQDQWHLYCPISKQDGFAHHAVSDDGLNFFRISDVSIPEPRSWIGNAVIVGEQLWFFGSGQGIWQARSGDGVEWKYDPEFQAAGGDPAVAVKENGNLLVIVTGPPREDARAGPPFQ